MRSPTAIATALVLAALTPPAAAASWQQVAAANGERVEIDKTGIRRLGPERSSAWTRLLFGREMKDDHGVYTGVQALNRYDCTARRFTTVRRSYLHGQRVVRDETVAAPREIVAEPGSIDDKLLTEACRLRTVGEAHQVADAAARAAAGPGKPGIMHADMRAAADRSPVRSVPVADKSPAAEPKAEAKPAPERPRFIDLPKIDKSQVEDPNAAPRPAEAKPAEKAAEKPADKPALSRQELERLYATSGPRKAPAVRRKPVEPAPAVVEHKHIHWSYEGEGAPANWAKLRPDYATCASGRRQSPIDIRDGIKVDLEPIRFDYQPSQVRIVDTGHSIQATVGEGSNIGVMGRTYHLQQFHFHRPSEERVNGKSFDMVVHLVHRDDEGRLAVIAVLLEKGPEHPIIQTLWNHMPLEVNQEVAPGVAIDLNALLPENRAYYTYMGSLTTPPCTEDVLWMVFKQPVPVSAEQVGIFARLYRNNARPVQPGNGRLIKENR